MGSGLSIQVATYALQVSAQREYHLNGGIFVPDFLSFLPMTRDRPDIGTLEPTA